MSKKINRITPLNEIKNMAGLTVTTALTDLKVLFNDLKEVYFKAGEIKTSDLGSKPSPWTWSFRHWMMG